MASGLVSSSSQVADDTGPDEQTLCALAKQNSSIYYYTMLPYISSKSDLAASMPKLAAHYHDDFCWATCYKPEFIAELMYRGFLPMAAGSGNNKVEILLPKIHMRRCLVMFADVPKPHGSTAKKAKKFEFSVNTCFAQVAAGIQEQHGFNWFYPRLVKVFTRMNEQWEQGWYGGRVRVHSFEVWHEGKLVAGECGYSCGQAYTSLSGFCKMDSAGTVQMFAMAHYLQTRGFQLWDLGMQLGYKEEEFGGKEYPRLEFLDLLSRYRDQASETPIRITEKINAKTLLTAARAGAPVANAKAPMEVDADVAATKVAAV